MFPRFVVSFTGKLDLAFLQKAETQLNDNRLAPNKEKTKHAQLARTRLRHAESLQRSLQASGRQPTQREATVLSDLRTGKLRHEANAATKASGWGRIKHADGSFEDITPNGGGIVRSVLDNVPLSIQTAAPDLRLARDGCVYTKQEFIQWYGDKSGETIWASATWR